LQVFASIFISFQDTISNNLLDFSRSYAILIFTIVFWTWHTLTASSFTLSRISWLGIALIAGIIILWKKYGHTLQKGKFERDTSLIKRQFKYALRVFLWANIWSLLWQVDQQMIINILGPEAAGYYSNFFSLLSLYSLVITPILTLIFPMVTEFITKNNHHQLKIFQNLLYKYFSLFALSISWIFFTFWKEISSIFFGTKFLYSGQLLVYVAPFLVLNVLFIINFGILAWLGQVKKRVKVLLIALIANIILNFLLLYIFKIWLPGAIIAMIIGWALLRLGSFRIIQKHQKISFDRMFLFKNIAVIIVISWIFLYGKIKFLVIDNSARYSNISYLILALCIYYTILAIVNYKNILTLKDEVKKLKET